MINQLRSENGELAQAFSKKDEENKQMRQIFQEIQQKQKKHLSHAKEASKLRKQAKAQEKDIKRLTGELSQQKQLNEEFKARIDELVKRGPSLN